MNPADKINRFLDFINEASLEHLPNTVVLYRADDSVIHSLEINLDSELLSILLPKEQTTLINHALRELIQRSHASSALFAAEDKKTIHLHYESAILGLAGEYPIIRDGGAIRIKPTPLTPSEIRFKNLYL